MTKARADLLVKDVIDIDQYFDVIASWDAFVARYIQKVKELKLKGDERSEAASIALEVFQSKLEEYKKHNNHPALSDLNKFLEIPIYLTSGETSAFLNEDVIEDKSILKLIPIIKSFINDSDRLKSVGEEYDRYLKRLEYLRRINVEELNEEEVGELGDLEKRLGQDQEARPEWLRASYISQRKYILSVDERNRLVSKVIKAIRHHVKDKANQVSERIIVKEGEVVDAEATKARTRSFVEACVAANFRVAELTIQFFVPYLSLSQHRPHFDKTVWDQEKKVIDNSLSEAFFQLVASFASDALDLSQQKSSAPSRAEVRLSNRQSRQSNVKEEDVQLLPIIENVRQSLTLLDPSVIASYADSPELDASLPVPQIDITPIPEAAASEENKSRFVRSLVHTRSVAASSSIWKQPETATAPVASSSNSPVASQNSNNESTNSKPSSFKKFRRKASAIFGPSAGTESKVLDPKSPKKG